ncbi:cytochrome P450 [Dactylosporangium fulvum]
MSVPRTDLPRDYNPFDRDHANNPHAVWEQARSTCPVMWSDSLNAWVVTDYRTARSVFADPTTFVNQGATAPVTPPPPPVAEILAEGIPASEIRPTVTRDGEDHDRIRRFLVSVLTPRYIAALEPKIRRLADRLVDELPADGRADFVNAFAYRLPLEVVLDLFGISGASGAQIHEWTTHAMSMFWGTFTLEEHLVAARGYVDFQRFLAETVQRARTGSGDDVVSRLVNLDIGGDAPLTDGEAVGLLLGLLSAGHETSMNLISLTMLQVLRSPSIWQRMIDDPSVIPAVVEEGLRFESPAHSIWRKAAADAELGGRTIAAGQRLSVVVGSANRDPAVFDHPSEFDPDRAFDSPHLSFGRGVHFCVGAPLARLEARVAFEVLTQRLPSLRLQPGFTPSYRPNSVQRFLERLDVEWDG